MTDWKATKYTRAMVKKRTARAIARSRRNEPKTVKHGRQHRTAV